MYEMQIRYDEDGMPSPDKWRSLKPRWPAGCPPYRYDDKQDAEAMLERLFPRLPASEKRVISV